jgi:amino acid transporter
MKLTYALKFMFVLFCAITTFQVIFIGVLSFIFGNDSVMIMQDMLRFPFVSFASVLPTLIFVRSEKKKTPSRAETIILSALHFTLTAGIVFGLLIYFKVMTATNAAYVIVFYLVVYITAYTFMELRDRKLAKQLNKRIEALHNAENETEA